MQFAGGMSIARVAEMWERDVEWVEEAIRQALLKSIPKRDGGTKISRADARNCPPQIADAARSRSFDFAQDDKAALDFDDGGV